jgi:2-polyprenyl-3-methyl-5-hydroxy-6-metoxy-1,4-benzoquinol methylase
MDTFTVPITYISAPATVSMADGWYDIASLDHFWIRRRLDVLRCLAEPIIRGAHQIAEIGCGNGLVQRAIEDEYGISVTGFDLNDFALKKNIARQSPIYCYDIYDRVSDFRARFDLVLLLDVIEHIREEAAFLESVAYHMTDSAVLIINVPAYQSLYSNYDRAVGHIRRYTISSLERVLVANGFRMRAATYWGAPLLPLLAARKALLTFRKQQANIVSSGMDPGSRVANQVLGQISRCEPLPQKMGGTSVMCVFEKATANQ